MLRAWTEGAWLGKQRREPNAPTTWERVRRLLGLGEGWVGVVVVASVRCTDGLGRVKPWAEMEEWDLRIREFPREYSRLKTVTENPVGRRAELMSHRIPPVSRIFSWFPDFPDKTVYSRFIRSTVPVETGFSRRVFTQTQKIGSAPWMSGPRSKRQLRAEAERRALLAAALWVQ
jgi:hypothetical protein